MARIRKAAHLFFLIRNKKGEEVINVSESWLTIKEVSNFEEVMHFHEFNSQLKQDNELPRSKLRGINPDEIKAKKGFR